jgi:hypothetical protein
MCHAGLLPFSPEVRTVIRPQRDIECGLPEELELLVRRGHAINAYVAEMSVERIMQSSASRMGDATNERSCVIPWTAGIGFSAYYEPLTFSLCANRS